jgi:hypothetical protein
VAGVDSYTNISLDVLIAGVIITGNYVILNPILNRLRYPSLFLSDADQLFAMGSPH